MTATMPFGAPGIGIGGLDPTAVELAALDTLPRSGAWAGLADAQAAALLAALGGFVSLFLLVAAAQAAATGDTDGAFAQGNEGAPAPAPLTHLTLPTPPHRRAQRVP